MHIRQGLYATRPRPLLNHAHLGLELAQGVLIDELVPHLLIAIQLVSPVEHPSQRIHGDGPHGNQLRGEQGVVWRKRQLVREQSGSDTERERERLLHSSTEGS